MAPFFRLLLLLLIFVGKTESLTCVASECPSSGCPPDGSGVAEGKTCTASSYSYCQSIWTLELDLISAGCINSTMDDPHEVNNDKYFYVGNMQYAYYCNSKDSCNGEKTTQQTKTLKVNCKDESKGCSGPYCTVAKGSDGKVHFGCGARNNTELVKLFNTTKVEQFCAAEYDTSSANTPIIVTCYCAKEDCNTEEFLQKSGVDKIGAKPLNGKAINCSVTVKDGDETKVVTKKGEICSIHETEMEGQPAETVLGTKWYTEEYPRPSQNYKIQEFGVVKGLTKTSRYCITERCNYPPEPPAPTEAATTEATTSEEGDVSKMTTTTGGAMEPTTSKSTKSSHAAVVAITLLAFPAFFL